jgi:hypothetical protein
MQISECSALGTDSQHPCCIAFAHCMDQNIHILHRGRRERLGRLEAASARPFVRYTVNDSNRSCEHTALKQQPCAAMPCWTAEAHLGSHVSHLIRAGSCTEHSEERDRISAVAHGHGLIVQARDDSGGESHRSPIHFDSGMASPREEKHRTCPIGFVRVIL